MSTRTLTAWAQTHPAPATVVAALALAAVVALAVAGRRATRRTPVAVLVASLAAMACTAYSADTSWRFAEHRLGMASPDERAAMFAAAELALFACGLMARQNLRDPKKGAPGAPGALVWVITSVQIIPAYSESGIIGGTVRAVVGPVLAALLWHLAMGIELRHTKPGADSASLPALLAREGRERLLSRLGLATRDRTAEQITRDRWTVKAVGLAARLADMEPGARGRARTARRLSVAVGKAQAGASAEQRTKLLELLAARRHAVALATIDLPSPWQDASQDAQDAEDAPASAPVRSTPAFPVAAPAGARILTIIARPQSTPDPGRDDEDAQDGPRPEPPLMTSNDVAQHYGIKPSTVRNWVADGRIPVHSKDAAGRNLFHPDDLPNFEVTPV
ncbi:helix-turn-helix domain-containing protein [Streptomyces sp. PBH53]|uniref:helix-turn-helix domain-containing protein n=1 Tax=Streptomyces sp. PBH53 TaxID=1577075 RepID=UPI000A5311FC|nr:helix-turn-helix domain-containing protein [Streptomyces sp. PBH53]